MRPTDRRARGLGRRVAAALLAAAGPGDGRLLIAGVSGGADSSAMLLLLADTQERHGWRLCAAHVDHCIQSDTIRAEFRAAACRLALRCGVPIHLLEADAPREAAASAGGLEAAARRVRYAALRQLAQRRGASIVATAHTRDDQAETVLLHLLRGAGLAGLSGMPARRTLAQHPQRVDLVRPMLDLTRTDAEAVCRAYGWSPTHDPSNDEQSHTRNRLRHSLLPLMRELNPNVSGQLAQLAASARLDLTLLEQLADEALSQVCDARGALQRRLLLKQRRALQPRILRAYCHERGIILSAERTAAALSVIVGGHGVVELPGGQRLTVANGTIQLGSSAAWQTPSY